MLDCLDIILCLAFIFWLYLNFLLPDCLLSGLRMDYKEFLRQVLKLIKCSASDMEEVKEAALEMPSVLAATVADSTGKRYLVAWKRFQHWCWTNKREAFPASKDKLGLYFIWLGRRSSSIAPVDSARSAISWFHTIASPDWVSPCDGVKIQLKENLC